MKGKKMNWDKVVYYRIIGDNEIIAKLQTARCPLALWHFVRKLAILFDKLGDKTRLVLGKLTKIEITKRF